MNNLLTVLILNRNQSDNVLRLISDLNKQTFQKFDIIVSDDNSMRNELEKLKQIKQKNLSVYSYPKPFKFGLVKKWNYGFKKALIKNPRYIYILQSDQKIFDDDLLYILIEFMEKNKQCGAAGPTMLSGTGEITWGPGIVKNRMGHNFSVSESFMIRSECLIKMGLWKDIFIYYGEEMDFFNWLRDNSYEVSVINNIRVKHYGGGVTKKFQNHKDYYRPRTSILIMKLYNKNDPLITKIKYLKSECWEQKEKLVQYKKSKEWIKFIKVGLLVSLGIIAGLVIPIKQSKKGYKLNV